MADDSLKDFVLDQLSALPGLSARSMFGGLGFYQDERFFGLMIEGRLYFKTDERSRVDYERRGMQPFVYQKARQAITIRYFEVPSEVLENRNELACWARRAVQAAEEAVVSKRKPLRRKAGPSRPTTKHRP